MLSEVKPVNTTDFDKSLLSPADTPAVVWGKDYPTSKVGVFVSGISVNTSSSYLIAGYVGTIWCIEGIPCEVKANILAADPYERLSDIEIYGDLFITANDVSETEAEELNRYFSIEQSDDLDSYLQSHKPAIGALIKTARYIEILFKAKLSRMILAINNDDEENYQGVVVTIHTSASSEDALHLLYQFDEGWWLDQDAETRASVTVLVRSI